MISSSPGRRLAAAAVGFATALVMFGPGGGGAGAAHATAVDEESIGRALVGISEFISEHADSIATGVTAACPLLTRDEFGWFMGQQGLRPSFDRWSVGLFRYEGVGGGAPGLSCGVDIAAHVAAASAADAPHGARLEAIAVPHGADLGDLLTVVQGGRVVGPGGGELGGELGGACFPGRVAVCVVMWYRSGLAIGTVLAGPATTVTESSTIRLMSSMIPTIVQGLTRYAVEFGPAATTSTVVPSTAPAPELDTVAARATLSEFVAARPTGTGDADVDADATCPFTTPTAIGQAMAAAGLPPALDQFRVSVLASAIAPGLITVSCGGDVIDALHQATSAVVPGYTPSLTVYDITGIGPIDLVLAERPGLVPWHADGPLLGGELYGGPCDVASGSGTFCVRVWHRDGLVVMFEVSGNARPGFDRAATDVITVLVPTVIADLANHTSWPAPAAGLQGAPITPVRFAA